MGSGQGPAKTVSTNTRIRLASTQRTSCTKGKLAAKKTASLPVSKPASSIGAGTDEKQGRGFIPDIIIDTIDISGRRETAKDHGTGGGLGGIMEPAVIIISPCREIQQRVANTAPGKENRLAASNTRSGTKRKHLEIDTNTPVTRGSRGPIARPTRSATTGNRKIFDINHDTCDREDFGVDISFSDLSSLSNITGSSNADAETTNASTSNE
ncbi:hypothetical protein N7467_001981 [Penicillium canescens]|nr:hypothetical protein N7467_001981 [Penicillium canescens]